jgi:hypothetical protein
VYGQNLGGILRRKLLAEFVVIVLGVLTALAVDTWVDVRQSAERAAEYRERLAADVRGDANRLRARWAYYERTLAWAVEARRVLSGQSSLLVDQQLFTVYAASLVYPFVPNKSTWEDMVSTGTLVLLEDPDLRAELFLFYQGLENGPVSWTPDASFRREVRKSLPPNLLLATIPQTCILPGLFDEEVIYLDPATYSPDPAPPTCSLNIPLDRADEILSTLRAIPDLEGLLNLRVSDAQTIAGAFMRQADRAVDLGSRIEAPGR